MIASLTDQATPARAYPYCAPLTSEMIAALSRRAYEYRTQVLRMVYGRKSGHIGGAFSIAEILTCLYFHQLRIDPANPKWEDRDRLVFSKGHACAMLYTDRKSTRLNSSHLGISYAVFCLKKKKTRR